MEWQPIETAPKDGSQFLIKKEDGAESKAYFYNGNLKVQGSGGLFWSPLGGPKIVGFQPFECGTSHERI